MTKLLEVRKLSLQIKDHHILNHVSFNIYKRETLALVGESGCGKSMTSQAIMRLLPEQNLTISGEILFKNQDILALTEANMRSIRGKKIGMIFQEPMSSLNPVLLIGSQMIETCSEHEALELLSQVGISDPERVFLSYPFELSGGMLQRVMIAMTLGGKPDLLIADEPTTALDRSIQAQILLLIKKLQHQYGFSLLFISHDLDVVSQVADRVALMYAGQIVELAPRDSFFAKPLHPYAHKLLASLPERATRGVKLPVIQGQVPQIKQTLTYCSFADRCQIADQHCHSELPKLTAHQNHHHVACHHVAKSSNILSKNLKNILQLFNMHIQYDLMNPLVSAEKLVFQVKKNNQELTILDHVTLQIFPKETLALVGESGSGKTTLGNAILKLIEPQHGTIRLKNIEQRDIQVIFQDPYSSLNPRMRTIDILTEGFPKLNQTERIELATTLLKQVQLSDEYLYAFPHQFSGGQRQRIAIARALSVKPKLIICDEAISALDVSVQAQILNLLIDLQLETGMSYLFITHNLQVVRYFAHRVAVMNQGKIVEVNSCDEIFNRPQHDYTKQLLNVSTLVHS